MANANPSRLGQRLQTGDPRELFRIHYLTEVMAAYKTKNITDNMFMTKTIPDGKSAKFPTSGIASVGYHSVTGSEILGTPISQTDKLISIDGQLYSATFIDELDDMMNHWDAQSVYSTEQGYALAKVNDIQKLALVINAARAAANIPGQTAPGTRLINAAMKTDANVLAANIFNARVQLDENGVPEEDTVGILSPALYALLVQNRETINKDYNGRGSYANGDIAAVGGVPLVKSTHLPKVDLSTNAAIDANAPALFGPGTDNTILPAQYRGNFSTTAAVVAHKGAVGTLILQDLVIEISKDPRRFGKLITVRQARGADILRPECAIELATAAL